MGLFLILTALLEIYCGVTGAYLLLHGYEPKDRPSVEKGITNALYLTDVTHPIPLAGKLTAWEIYAKMPGTVYLQVMREITEIGGPNVFAPRVKLAGQTRVTAVSAGLRKIQLSPSQQISVVAGDHIAVYFPDKNIIPFTNSRRFQFCRVYYKKNPGRLSTGDQITFGRQDSNKWRTCANFSIRATIEITSPALLHGNTPTNRQRLEVVRESIFIVSPKQGITTAGNVSYWEFYAPDTGRSYHESMNLVIMRKQSGDNRYKLIGTDAQSVIKRGPQFAVVSPANPIKVSVGDVIGFHCFSSCPVKYDVDESCSSGNTLVKRRPRGWVWRLIGRTFKFRPVVNRPCRKYSLRVAIQKTD